MKTKALQRAYLKVPSDAPATFSKVQRRILMLRITRALMTMTAAFLAGTGLFWWVYYFSLPGVP